MLKKLFFLFIIHFFISPGALAEELPSTSFREDLKFPDITLILKHKSQTLTGSEIRKWVSVRPTIFSSNQALTEIINPSYCRDMLLCDFIFSRKTVFSVEKKSTLSLSSDTVLDYLEAINPKLKQEPVDAKFHIKNENAALFSPEEKGYAIDLEKATNQLHAILLTPEIREQTTASLELPAIVIEPKIKSSEVNQLGISALIGEGKSNFKGSTKSRVHNINVAAKHFDGLIIKPGEEFSFVENLGPVDAEHNYLPELVILNNRTQPEFGGGICQVSTTVFRAAIYSGLEITSRKNHAYAVAYYNPPGMDATVYIPKPDLKFINNTPGHILIKMTMTGTELSYQIYGTGDGRTVTVSSPEITKKNDDGSFATSFNQKVIEQSGRVILDNDFQSFYKNPKDFPKPGEEKLTEKPKDWSSKEWRAYKKANNL